MKSVSRLELREPYGGHFTGSCDMGAPEGARTVWHFKREGTGSCCAPVGCGSVVAADLALGALGHSGT